MHQSESNCWKSKGTLKTCRVERGFSVSSDKIWSDLTVITRMTAAPWRLSGHKNLKASDQRDYRTSTVRSNTCSLVTAEAHTLLSKHACKHPHGTTGHEWHKCYGSTPCMSVFLLRLSISLCYRLLFFSFLCPCILVFSSSSPLSCSSYLTHDSLSTQLKPARSVPSPPPLSHSLLCSQPILTVPDSCWFSCLWSSKSTWVSWTC